ncbi:MAG: hypothetical protein RBT49_09610 [Bacteroidales bacterium]|jgi:hypothetical protein|nr:hypothetical protein [Bacteroidales bacterium]
MLVIQNRNIKKGIEIPEIQLTILPFDEGVKASAIDKVKYAEFLSLNPRLFATFNIDSELIVSAYYYVDYTGDEIELTNGNLRLYGIYGISYYLLEY